MTTAQRVIILNAAWLGLAVAFFIGALRITAEAQSMSAARAWGMAGAIVLGTLAESIRRRVRGPGLGDGFLAEAIRRFPLAHLMLAVSAIAALSALHFAVLAPDDYAHAMMGSFFMTFTVMNLYFNVIAFRSEQVNERDG